MLHAGEASLEFVLPPRLAALDTKLLIDTGQESREGERIAGSCLLLPHSSALARVRRRTV